jgi:hypothetical protein
MNSPIHYIYNMSLPGWDIKTGSLIKASIRLSPGIGYVAHWRVDYKGPHTEAHICGASKTSMTAKTRVRKAIRLMEVWLGIRRKGKMCSTGEQNSPGEE